MQNEEGNYKHPAVFILHFDFCISQRGLSSEVERRFETPRMPGSTPGAHIVGRSFFAVVTQLAECRSSKLEAVGSIPARCMFLAVAAQSGRAAVL